MHGQAWDAIQMMEDKWSRDEPRGFPFREMQPVMTFVFGHDKSVHCDNGYNAVLIAEHDTTDLAPIYDAGANFHMCCYKLDYSNLSLSPPNITKPGFIRRLVVPTTLQQALTQAGQKMLVHIEFELLKDTHHGKQWHAMKVTGVM